MGAKGGESEEQKRHGMWTEGFQQRLLPQQRTQRKETLARWRSKHTYVMGAGGSTETFISFWRAQRRMASGDRIGCTFFCVFEEDVQSNRWVVLVLSSMMTKLKGQGCVSHFIRQAQDLITALRTPSPIANPVRFGMIQSFLFSYHVWWNLFTCLLRCWILADVPTFDYMNEVYAWKPIKNCPGRFTLSKTCQGADQLTPSQLVGIASSIILDDCAFLLTTNRRKFWPACPSPAERWKGPLARNYFSWRKEWYYFVRKIKSFRSYLEYHLWYGSKTESDECWRSFDWSHCGERLFINHTSASQQKIFMYLSKRQVFHWISNYTKPCEEIRNGLSNMTRRLKSERSRWLKKGNIFLHRVTNGRSNWHLKLALHLSNSQGSIQAICSCET